MTTDTEPRIIEKTMTLSPAEFTKSMKAFAGDAVVIVGGRATLPVDETAGTATIAFSPLPPRRVGGLLELPQAKVIITLVDVSIADAGAFLKRFDIAFQRGGG